MFSEDADTALKEGEIEFLCYKYGGFWDFPKWPDIDKDNGSEVYIL